VTVKYKSVLFSDKVSDGHPQIWQGPFTRGKKTIFCSAQHLNLQLDRKLFVIGVKWPERDADN